MKLYAYPFILLALAFNSFVAQANDAELPNLDITMSLHDTQEDILRTNPQLAAVNKAKKQAAGIMSLRGPLTFNFSYDGQQLVFDQVKAVIYPVSDYKVDYIHLFPQLNYLTPQAVYQRAATFKKQLETNGWLKQYYLADDVETNSSEFDQAVKTLGKKDLANFRYQPQTATNEQPVEAVFTILRDLAVPCSRDKNSVEADCANRSLRVALYPVKAN